MFGAPLAIEGLAAFMLESTFLGLWIFGWDRLRGASTSRRSGCWRSGRWLSAFFIIVGQLVDAAAGRLDVVDGRAELTDVWALMTNRFGICAFMHVILVGLTTAAVDRASASAAGTSSAAATGSSSGRRPSWR